MGVRQARTSCQDSTSFVRLVSQMKHISKRLQVNQKARSLSEQPDHSMLTRLRVLEQKMGLVLTLVFLSSPLFRQKHESR